MGFIKVKVIKVVCKFGSGRSPQLLMNASIWYGHQGPKIYFKRHFKAEKCFTENNISKIKRVLQVESQHPAYDCKCVTITC